ncbi:MAG: (2Fe-2S)-binding protein [Alphaproteobacteria bacterium]|nr:(2Fe-2S)-binding protein [Alphaproteobacteria bacterium]
MYICICNALSDRQFLQALKDAHGVTSVEELYVRTSGGITPRCGRCLETVREMLESARDITAEAAE